MNLKYGVAFEGTRSDIVVFVWIGFVRDFGVLFCGILVTDGGRVMF